jgi:hypothetical protein
MSVIEMDMDKKRVMFKEINDLMVKIQTLTEEMRSVTDAPRKTNLIVDRVLRHALTSMGITTKDDEKDYVSSLLTHG